mmetsp:Transcript_10469/g.12739  ORF Transcript_10469/g.12739 Transcript_10469/m.12739 type:complete len:183 (-) Transcript_10469:169-717(-)|eukprot:CAMPEP_0114335450 /NCGR_PEP_ID=MMETSP0101-20121206/5068_1 /TAXON_ID=38822 ORGANISM="Pteridomonas danica, Strain PT" /NCGR_SAMPLE_ID=MMETSP0101 /ASSEMBLY_ACC=CAM_ASM_000211 /LENGTH=182 /DNA_ID=CAMNT_0001467083 /DNA_START=9 /DNA_END=557 /DNA_ORIENTATION=-
MRQNQNLRDDIGTEMRTKKYNDMEFFDEDSYIAPSARSVLGAEQQRQDREEQRERYMANRFEEMRRTDDTSVNDNFNIHTPLPNIRTFEDDEDETKSPPACAVCCTIFSASGIVFLAGVSAALKNDNMYMLLDSEEKRPSFATSVDGAIYLYVATFCISLIYWVRIYTAPKVDLVPKAKQRR